MHIFYAAADSPNAWALPSSKIWRNNLYKPLVDLGHDVTLFDYDYGRHNASLDVTDPEQRPEIERLRPLFGTELLRQVCDAHHRHRIDLFFSYFYSAFVHPEVIREIGRMGIATVNWYCNASFQFDLIREIAPAYDYCLVPEKFRLEDYRHIGANPIYCQEAANPNVYCPRDLPREFDVTFVGQRYGNRPNYIKRLIEAGVDVRVFGPRWDEPPGRRFNPTGQSMAAAVATPLTPADTALSQRASGAVSDDELIAMYSRSRISLGFAAVAKIPSDGSPPIKQVRLRDFEAPMSGAFYLTEYLDELTEFFEPDKEIVCFRDADELAEKAKYYLDHDRERDRIRCAGLARARAEHTWHARFRRVFHAIGFDSSDGARKSA